MNGTLHRPPLKPVTGPSNRVQVVTLGIDELKDLLAEAVRQGIQLARKDNEDLLTMNEACQLLQKHRNTLDRWHEEGILPRMELGGSIYYFKSQILAKLKGE